MSKPLSLGFIGGSVESAVGCTHQIACEMDGHWKLTAGCFSRHEKINQTTADLWGLSAERTYDDWESLLEKEQSKLDAVAILTPTPTHAEIASKALAMGYAVICEKALTCSTQQAQDLKSIATKNNSFLAVTYNYSGYPMVRELQAMIKADKLGKILQIQIEMPQEGFIRVNAQGQPNKPQDWRLKDEAIPTISLDLGTHTHHLIHFLTQERPVSVVASQSNLGHFSGIVDNVMCMAKYTNDLQCQIWYSKTALGHRNGLRLRIYGDKASAEWYQLNPEELLLNHHDGTRETIDRAANVTLADAQRYNRFKAGHPSGFIEAFANLYADIAQALTHYRSNKAPDSPYVYGIDHALEGCRLFDAINQSSHKDCWIALKQENETDTE